MALIVADINIGDRVAEIWQGNRRLARLRKTLGVPQCCWEVA